MAVNAALFGAQIGSAQTTELNPEILSAKARIAYGKLAKACIFRVGGVGYAGQTSKEELTLYDLLEDPHARTVITQSGCIIGVEQRDKIVTAIQSGHCDRMLNAKYRSENE